MTQGNVSEKALLTISAEGFFSERHRIAALHAKQVRRILLYLACHLGKPLEDCDFYTPLDITENDYRVALTALRHTFAGVKDAGRWTGKFALKGVELLELDRDDRRDGPKGEKSLRLTVLAPDRVHIADLEPFLASLSQKESETEVQPGPPNNLPVPISLFIGREEELGALDGLLAGSRLLTLTGAGGCGKTRLALQTAARAVEEYPDGVWLVELAALADPSLIASTVAQALGVREQPGLPVERAVLDFLKNKRLLLLLDNCEHLLAPCAELATAVLRSCPDVRILATSRERLAVTGEQVYPVAPLSVPDPEAAGDSQGLARYDSVRLFVERASRVRPDFRATDQNAPDVARVCQRLDGIPLALELAAARVRSLSLEELNDRLDRRFQLLTGGDSAGLPHHRTLSALMDWSYDLLSDMEKTLFARLSVFSGGWTLAAAEEVCGFEPLPAAGVFDALTGLVDKSLVLADVPAPGDATRYRMLETVHAYADEKLRSSAEADTAIRRHWEWGAALALKASVAMEGHEQRVWLERLESEHNNLRAALSRSLAHASAEAAEVALQIPTRLDRFWLIRGHVSEGRRWLEKALSCRTERRGDHAEAMAHLRCGGLAMTQGDNEFARRHLEEGLFLFRALNDQDGIAASLNNLASVASGQGRYADARSLLEENLPIVRQAGNTARLARVLSLLGNLLRLQGDYNHAWSLFQESLALRRASGDNYALSITLDNLGMVAAEQGDPVLARSLVEESLALSRELRDRLGIGYSLHILGGFAVNGGDSDEAEGLLREGLVIARELGDKTLAADSLGQLGRLALRRGDPVAARVLYRETAAISDEADHRFTIAFILEGFAAVSLAESAPRCAALFLGAANALRESMGAPVPASGLQEVNETRERASAALGEGTFREAWEEGTALGWEHCVRLILQDSESA